jgi:hypothetical protein
MKYTWEPDDVVVGRRFFSHNGSEEYMVGYDISHHDGSKLCIISCIDGMVSHKKMSKTDVARHLNESECSPKHLDPKQKG